MAACEPEPPQGAGEARALRGVSLIDAPAKCGSEVVVFALQRIQADRLVRSDQTRLGCLRQ